MGNKKNIKKELNNVISASEIGQYYFCSNSWLLQKCGYIPISKNLEIGKQKHEKLGKIINNLEKQNKKSSLFRIAGIILLAISIIFVLFEVIF